MQAPEVQLQIEGKAAHYRHELSHVLHSECLTRKLPLDVKQAPQGSKTTTKTTTAMALACGAVFELITQFYKSVCCDGSVSY